MNSLALSLVLLLFPIALLAQEETGTAPNSSKAPKKLMEGPRFPGCENLEMTPEQKKACSEQKLMQFVYKNIKYPVFARENDIQGTAVISFIIETDGTLSDIQIVRDLGGGLGEEAKRVFELMNTLEERWTPGKQGGEAVRVKMNFPVKFKLEGKAKKKKKNKKKG